MIVNIKKLNDKAVTPSCGSEYAAGYDLYANFNGDTITIPAGETVKVGTGIAMEIPDGLFGAVFARSGLATKQGLRPANGVGVIDSDYRGEIIVALHNDSKADKTVQNGDRIAQIVIIPFLKAEFNELDELSDTERGEGGFGSTDMSSEQLNIFDYVDREVTNHTN